MSASVEAVLQAAVDSGAVPHVVGVAADHQGVTYEGAAGPRAAGEDEPVDTDSIFRIASMTKIVCTVAALQQHERGNLDFHAPVDTYCPDFAAVPVLDGFDGDTPRLRAPASRATVKQLATHTAGLAYSYWNADIIRWEAAGGAASGQALDHYLSEHILSPLGMRSTAFLLNDEQRARCVPVHVKDGDGGWVATDIDWDQHPDWWPGGHGLYSTPRDFLRFQRMLLGGGTLAGTTILDRSSVREAFTNQIGELWFPAEMPTVDPGWSRDFVAGPGRKWGWGLLLNTHQQPGMRAAGSGGWAGMFHTQFWVDPHTMVTGALYTQTLPFAAPEARQLSVDFERALYASHKDARGSGRSGARKELRRQ